MLAVGVRVPNVAEMVPVMSCVLVMYFVRVAVRGIGRLKDGVVEMVARVRVVVKPVLRVRVRSDRVRVVETKCRVVEGPAVMELPNRVRDVVRVRLVDRVCVSKEEEALALRWDRECVTVFVGSPFGSTSQRLSHVMFFAARISGLHWQTQLFGAVPPRIPMAFVVLQSNGVQHCEQGSAVMVPPTKADACQLVELSPLSTLHRTRYLALVMLPGAAQRWV